MKQKKVNHCLVFLFATILFIACGGKTDKAKETTTGDTAKSGVNFPADTLSSVVKLICKNGGVDSLETPYFDVMLSVNGKEIKIKTINGCGDIPKADYNTYEIPAEAVSACGGWWAGAGDYYYVVMKNGKPALFEGWMDETQKEKGYHWKEISYN